MLQLCQTIVCYETLPFLFEKWLGKINCFSVILCIFGVLCWWTKEIVKETKVVRDSFFSTQHLRGKNVKHPSIRWGNLKQVETLLMESDCISTFRHSNAHIDSSLMKSFIFLKLRQTILKWCFLSLAFDKGLTFSAALLKTIIYERFFLNKSENW